MRTIILVMAMVLSFSNLCLSQNEEQKDVEKVNKQSTIIFKNTVYDYGTISQGSDGIAEFEFKNMSKDNVNITNVRTSCGCAGADWPRETIKKKKNGKITVTYDTKIIGKFHKVVYVYIDKLEKPVKLEIKGEVVPSNANKN